MYRYKTKKNFIIIRGDMISMPAVGIKRKLEGPFDYISDKEKFDQHNF